MFRKMSCIEFAVRSSRGIAVVLAAAGLLLPAGCQSSAVLNQLCKALNPAEVVGSFVGGIGESAALMSLDVTGCAGNKRVRIFLTDGAAEGQTEYFDGAVASDQFDLTSASGKARINGNLTLGRVEGTVKLGDEAALPFLAIPAVDGAGLYEVNVSADGTWSGTGPAGATLEASQDDKVVEGVITDGSGQRFEYRVRDLSRTFGEAATGGAPDNYLVIVLPRGDAQIGRGGADSLKTGGANASANFIRLDLPASNPTPGTFFGRFQDLPDLIGFEFNEPDSAGNRHVRVFVTDGQPVPNGRAEWFSGDFAGEFPDETFGLDSISGNAHITGLKKFLQGAASRRARIAHCECCWPTCGCPCGGIGGTMELADGSQHAFYVVPAGEGAGIYEVKMESGRMHGTSIQGGTLDLHIDNGRVTGTLTAPDGTVIDYQADDLGQAFSDPAKLASVPDTFVVLAAPRGRFLVGSPGNVHGLVVIAIIAVLIGLLVPAVQRTPCQCSEHG